VEGTPLIDINTIILAFTDYYHFIFGTKEANNIMYDLTNDVQNRQLVDIDSPFTSKEVKLATFSLTKGKVARPDDFSAEFYQSYWNIIGNDFVQLIQLFYYNQLDLWGVNQACITFIPKKREPHIQE
jgi:hypothetical protein